MCVGQTIRFALGVLALGVVLGGCGSASPSAPPAGGDPRAAAAALPLMFEPNLGQADARVTHVSRGADHTLLMTRRGAVLKVLGPARREAVVGMTFAGADPAPRVSGRGLLPSVSNYLRGHDASRWITGVPNYSQVIYRGLYDGVDLAFHASRAGELEFDYMLAPGADPDRIRLAYTGTDGMRIDDSGTLVLRVGGGEIRQAPPVVFQTIGGERRRVTGSYVLRGAREVGFELEGYDRRAALLIDPVISYSTYLGGSGDDGAIWSDVDRAGNFYVTGITFSPDYPTTGGAYQEQPGGGGLDAFVTKVNPSGSGLVWSTYLGGSDFDLAIGLDVDRFGNVVVTGPTGSRDFPTTDGAYRREYAGGDSDTFVTKLDASGSRLLFSTLLGGAAGEAGFISFFDRRGNVYVEGETGSGDFPTTQRAFQPTYGGGDADGFVTKLKPDGSALVYSTFIGGSGYDGAHDGWLDEHNQFYIDGPTQSIDFPTSRGAYQRTLGGGQDVFAAKLNARGTDVRYSTYLGGEGFEDVFDMTADRFGNAYLPGVTESATFPVTRKAFQGSLLGVSDGYVTKLNRRGTGLEYSTYIGGSQDDVAGGVRVDSHGDAHIPGITGSPDFPVTNDAFQPTYGGGDSDAYVLTLNRRGSRARFSSFLGGSGNDGSAGSGEWLDDHGNFYIPGFTNSDDFPVTAGAYQTTHRGGDDVFLVKIAPSRREHGDDDDERGADVLRRPAPLATPRVERRARILPARGRIR